MNFQLANVRRKSDDELAAIADRVEEIRATVESTDGGGWKVGS
jgi:hypothetical protein